MLKTNKSNSNKLMSSITLVVLVAVHIASTLVNGQQQQQVQPAPQLFELNQNVNSQNNKVQEPPTDLNQKNAQIPNRQGFLKRTQGVTLYYSKECQDDIARYCPSAQNSELSDLAVLRCIHNQVSDLNLIDKECHNVNLV